MEERNRLVLIGNGFDLAHGLKTSYRNFMDWYVCTAFGKFSKNHFYQDTLIEFNQVYTSTSVTWEKEPNTFEEVINHINSNKQYLSCRFSPMFFDRLINSFKENNWIDIEKYYFKRLKSFFSNTSSSEKDKKEYVEKLNREFDFLIIQLANYIKTINEKIPNTDKLRIDKRKHNLHSAIAPSNQSSKVMFLNFNYTETLTRKCYATEEDVVHIHGRVKDISKNPIIFGYGDETDPVYQSIEDSGENIYLEHIKSFGYFRTGNYHKLLSYIDSSPYEVYIIGHSCGLSDRVLLNEIFEHRHCRKIEIFYHQRNDGSDNFKEITQEISRHFRPENKNMMRRRVGDKNTKNIIPQNRVKV